MRIDKYLWCVRIFKTRALAADDIKKGRVEVNGEVAKASRVVKTGDACLVRRHGYYQLFEVLDIPKNRVGAKGVEALLRDITPTEELEKKEMLSLARALTRHAGEGRPTKRDRRRLDDLQG